MTAAMLDHARLIQAGWTRTMSGRWTHTAFPIPGSKRLKSFRETDALALLDASPTLTNHDPED